MQIIRAQPQDAGALTQIAHAAKRHWNYRENWIQKWEDVLTLRPEVIAENPAYCAIDEGRPIGFYVLTSEAGKLHLDHLWILPNEIGRGVGRRLFEHAVQTAKRLGNKTIIIESDPNAEGFYKRMGARRIGETVTTIEGQCRELPVLQYDFPQTMT